MREWKMKSLVVYVHCMAVLKWGKNFARGTMLVTIHGPGKTIYDATSRSGGTNFSSILSPVEPF